MLQHLQSIQTYQPNHEGKIFNLTGECILILKCFLISQFTTLCTHEPMCITERSPMCITEMPPMCITEILPMCITEIPPMSITGMPYK